MRVGGCAARQGAGVEALLRVFEVVRIEHEGMDADTFNNDATYKSGLIVVRARRERGGLVTGRNSLDWTRMGVTMLAASP